MAKTRSRSFSARNQVEAKTQKIWPKQGSRAFLQETRASRGLSARNQWLKHDYVYKPEVYNVKR
jgi:hypothetical protein